ncbi:hypothetical protein LK07_16680 [Streptomyces pluripotens]|uniref:Uncharacterized protein n=1 Tax=Streptomyces pluripotens TaxID=1355015 RepID=A0A221P8J8_9ACTN|nr:hypothetical protein LK06_015545 [Streptomyces pluripotens]ASN28472.1 hypothetical protein LK07_16680 [Streptomyces pluripotens]
MGEVDLRHATTAEHLAQLVPAAEATRLFHSYLPALSVGLGRHARERSEAAVRAYGTRLALYDLAKPGTRYRTGIATCIDVKGV